MNRTNAGAPPSSPSSASDRTASSSASDTPASASKRPPSAAATPGSYPIPAASTLTTSPPPSHNSSETSASGPLHSTGAGESLQQLEGEGDFDAGQFRQTAESSAHSLQIGEGKVAS